MTSLLFYDVISDKPYYTINSTLGCYYSYSFQQWIFVTGPAKRDQVGTKYTNSHNGKYIEFCVQYLLSVSCKMLPMKLLTDGKNFTYIALVDHKL